MFAVETNDLDATVALFISNTSPEFDVFPEAANPGVKSFVIIYHHSSDILPNDKQCLKRCLSLNAFGLQLHSYL